MITISIESSEIRAISPIGGGWDWVYIPMSADEALRYAPNTLNPCWCIGIRPFNEDKKLEPIVPWNELEGV
jgi:hypothetical protein